MSWIPRMVHPLAMILSGLLAVAGHAKSSARLDLPASEAWTGQRISFSIELRADGAFVGAPSFDIPEIPDTVVLKVGNPVLGSVTEDEIEFFTQRHEFALFSQADGPIELPSITARFSHRKGYTGPSFDVSEQTKPAGLTIRRPPGSADLGFLVSTPSFEVEESWDPRPDSMETGAIVKRTIVQKASGMTGIALAPAPTTATDGIRVYVSEPEVNDRTERGEFSGERREILTYLVQQPGRHTLPAIRYDWWNPDIRKLESSTLPAVSFTAKAPPPPPPKPSPFRFLRYGLPLVLILLGWCFRARIAVIVRSLRDTVDPPANRAARKFLRACRRDDPTAAIRFWAAVRRGRPDLVVTPELDSRLMELHRRIYGPGQNETWSGRPLAAAFHDVNRNPAATPDPSPLPLLNP